MKVAYAHESTLMHTHRSDGLISFSEGLLYYIAIVTLIAICLLLLKQIIARR